MIITDNNNEQKVIEDFDSSKFKNVDEFRDYFEQYVGDMLDDEEWEPFFIYNKNFSTDYSDTISDSIDRFHNSYCGYYDSPEEFCREFINDCYVVDKVIYPYIDFEAIARDWFDYGDYVFEDGYIFRIC